MAIRFFIGLFLLASISVRVAAQTGYSNLEFVENKGQWDKSVMLRGELANGAFFLQKKGFTVLLHKPEELSQLTDNHRIPIHKSNTHNFTAGKQSANNADTQIGSPFETLHSHAYKVSFENGNEQASIIPDKPLPTYNNYFIGKDQSKWAAHCNIYQAVTYKNIYPNIDVRYYSNNGQLKYDIIIHPGGDINRIVLKYEGTSQLSLSNNRLLIKTSVGNVQELEPVSYQYNHSGKNDLDCKYVLDKNNLVKFKIKNYSPDATLIIDPTLVFATFTGSKASNWGFTATPGPDGSFYAGGIVFNEFINGFPVSPGAFSRSFNGGTIDVGIMKFNSNGTNRVYATYLGGSADETPHSLFCDPQGNLVILGRTYSDNFPILTTVGSGGGADIFVVKLNSTGTALIGSMRIGGSADDGVNIEDQFQTGHEAANSLIRNYGDDSRSEVVLDGANNIYVAASTKSLNFPTTAGSFQPAFGGGDQDGVVIKINPNCNAVLFASYLGGFNNDAAFVLKLNPANGDIYVAGATASTNFPGNKAGSIQSTFQGGVCDGFVVILSNDGSTLKTTSFLGTTGADAIYGIQFDKKGFPYVMGTTTGAWPVTPNVGFINAGAKQFVSKMLPDLSAFVYSTTFGTAAGFPNISPVAFLVDRCENVYVSGWGGWLFARTDPYGLAGTIGMPVTPNAIKTNTDGRDFYFIVIKKDATNILYGTFYGQTDGPQSISEHVDGGTSRYDQFGVIYQAICANCSGRSLSPFPTTPGVWAPVNGTSSPAGVAGCNLAAIKIAFNFAGVAANLKTVIRARYDSTGCVPLDVHFVDTVHNAKSYIWDFGDGSPEVFTTDNQQDHTYGNIGSYKVRLIAIDSTSCNVSDTVYTVIRARNDQANLGFVPVKLPPCQSLSYQFENSSTFPVGKPFNDSSFVWDFGDGSPPMAAGTASVMHSFASAGTYIVKLTLVDTNYCNYPDQLVDTLRVAPLVKALFETPPAGCAPYTAIFNNTSLAGQKFYWDFGDGSTDSSFNPTHFYPNIGTYTIHLIAIDSATCNIIDSTKQTITVNPKPQAAFTDQPVPPVANTPTIFYNGSIAATHYKWIFGDGDSALSTNLDTVKHQYQRTGTFQACLVAFNQFECPDTVCHPVETIINPLLDVPNAFTPGRFGQNAVIKVQGFGIASMDFKIYNRWGQIVFQTNNPNQGWDGNYNGKPQAMDVYAYTLEVLFFDGTKTTRKGDITLIR